MPQWSSAAQHEADHKAGQPLLKRAAATGVVLMAGLKVVAESWQAVRSLLPQVHLSSDYG